MSNGNDRGEVLPWRIGGTAGAAKPTGMVERTALTGELALSFLSFVDEHAGRDGGVDAAERSAIDGRWLVRWRPRSGDGGRIRALCVDDAALRRHLAEERRALILTYAELLRGLTEPDVGEAKRAPTS